MCIIGHFIFLSCVKQEIGPGILFIHDLNLPIASEYYYALITVPDAGERQDSL